MNGVASGADRTQAIFPAGDAMFNGMTALRAESNVRAVHDGAQKKSHRHCSGVRDQRAA